MTTKVEQESIETMKAIIRDAGLKVEGEKIEGNEDLFFKAVEHTGVTPASAKQHSSATICYTAASHGVATEVAIDAMAKDKDLKKVNTEFALGSLGTAKGSIAAATPWEIKGADGEKKSGTSYGTNRVAIEIGGGRQGSAINAEIAAAKALAASKLGG